MALATEPAAAQQYKRPTLDGNGVDVIVGQPYVRGGGLSIGDPAQGGLDYYWVWNRLGSFSNLDGKVVVSGTTVTVTIGELIETFTQSGSSYNSDDGRGSILTKNAASQWTYTVADGTAYFFENPGTLADGAASTKGLLTTITRPDGLQVLFQNKYQYFCIRSGSFCSGPSKRYARLQSVSTNAGYQMHLDYLLDLPFSSTPANIEVYDPYTWMSVKGITAFNMATEYCDPTANTCSFTQTWPKLTFSGGNITDSLNNTTTTTQSSGGMLSGIKRPANTSDDFSLTYDGSARIASVTRGSGTWNYTYSDVGTQRTTTVTQPLGGSKIYVSDTAQRKLISVTDELSRTTSYTYDSYIRPTRVTQPEGNYTELTYDGRGNVTQTRRVAKSGSGLSDIVTSASFDTSCSNAKTCNKPNSTIDGLGYQTDYTYDSTHGGLLTVTLPPASPGATRPQTRYGYTALNAYYKNSSGTIVAAASSIYKLTSTSACVTGSSCSGTSDEVKSTIAYGSTGVANNLLPTSISKGSGDGALTATTAQTYDVFGNVTSVDGPLSGTADTSGFTYDANRRLTLAISPDPDGAGSLSRRARRYTYNGNGSVTKVELGTASSLTGPFTADASGIRQEIAYDSLGRKAQSTAVSGTSTINTLGQLNYDDKGRVNCIAVRMNPANFASPPSDACALGTAGSYGDDRISQTVYDNADQPTQLKVAVGTSDAANERTLTYSNNGLVTSLTDAENNKTTYVADGFDRPYLIQYPSATKGSVTSNSADYEQFGLDNNGNVGLVRNRAGQTFNLTYDYLNRLTFKDRPGTDADVTYTYDLLSRMTSAVQYGTSLTFAYDALSRQTSEAGQAATVYQQFDLAGRRTQLSTSSGYLLNFTRLVTGEMTAIVDGSSNTWASMNYDNLGRRTSLSYGDGSSASYTYDAVSRLASLSHDFSGTTYDVTKTFAYNPASQIVSETRNNDAYAYTSMGNGSLTTVSNGLNQLTAVGSGTPTYDANGNLTYDPVTGKSYLYTSDNQLTQSNGTGLYYDPLDRLMLITPSSGARKFVYAPGESGAPEPIQEVDGSNALVTINAFGPGPDEALVSWEAATSTLHMLHADERGSIVASGNGTGGVFAINAYDEYGRPAASNAGRFQYTGQMWLHTIGLQYSKARMYDPALGRFMQTDPIGVASGINLYAYTGNDPVNWSDPWGLQESPIFVIGSAIAPLGHTGGAAAGRPFADRPGCEFKLEELEGHTCDAGGGGATRAGCPVIPISPAEEAAAKRGDRRAFWETRAARGDPLASTALAILKNEGGGAKYANLNLASALFFRDPTMSAADRAAEMNKIGVELMLAHRDAVRQFQSPSARDIADYHYRVFAAHGLGRDTFAGGGNRWAADVSARITGWTTCH